MENKENSKRIYLIFSITKTKIGKVIRKVTHYPYSHVSVALEPDLSIIYSFGRHYKSTPFYGGFVRESHLRYRNSDGTARILVCAVPVTPEQYNKAVEYIHELSSNNKVYLYNMISAACATVNRRVLIDRAYTCAEFAIELLAHCGVENAPDPRRFCSIKQLIEIYEKYTVYEGPFPEHCAESIEDYERELAMLRRMRVTVSMNARLVGRFCRGLVHIR